MTRPIPSFLPPFVKRVEGVEQQSYQDSAGVWTIGVGHTGPEVHAGLRWTMKQVDAALREDLQAAAVKLHSVVKRDVIEEMTDHQYAALVSFVFNLGAGKDWQIWKRLNARQWDQVPVEMARFDKARVNGKLVKLQGLVNRRNAEIALWATEEPGSADERYASGSLRMMETPPTPAEKGAGKGKAAAAGGIGVLGFAGAVEGVQKGARAAQDIIEPGAYHSDILMRLLTIVVLVGAGAGLALLAVRWWNKRAAR